MRTIQKQPRALPSYTIAEEKFNTLSHAFGMLIGLAMMIMSWHISTSVEGRITGMVFGGSLVLLYLASTLYHWTPARFRQMKAVLRVADHASIFVLCAGSCTPFLYAAFQNAPQWLGWLFNLYIWLIALVGITLLVIDLSRFKKFSIALYILMGVSMMLLAAPMRIALGESGFALMLAGALIYCAGLVLYSIKKPWFHSVFHVLCIIASCVHCACVALYII